MQPDRERNPGKASKGQAWEERQILAHILAEAPEAPEEVGSAEGVAAGAGGSVPAVDIDLGRYIHTAEADILQGEAQEVQEVQEERIQVGAEDVGCKNEDHEDQEGQDGQEGQEEAEMSQDEVRNHVEEARYTEVRGNIHPVEDPAEGCIAGLVDNDKT